MRIALLLSDGAVLLLVERWVGIVVHGGMVDFWLRCSVLLQVLRRHYGGCGLLRRLSGLGDSWAGARSCLSTRPATGSGDTITLSSRRRHERRWPPNFDPQMRHHQPQALRKPQSMLSCRRDQDGTCLLG